MEHGFLILPQFQPDFRGFIEKAADIKAIGLVKAAEAA
jgi:hypothetical protein